jgi:hypothetical protein
MVGRGDHVGARLAQPARELATNASYDRETQIRLTTGSERYIYLPSTIS